jgi:hypothetical protein
VFSGRTELPFGFQGSAIWRLQSGRPWSPEQSGDLNADGRRFRDRVFVFAPEDLPLVATSGGRGGNSGSATHGSSTENPCIGNYVGQIIPRNTCRQPWFNKLDLRVRRAFTTVAVQSAELEIDLFNVLNALSSDWGRYHTVSGGNRNLVRPQSYDAATNRILYDVPPEDLERNVGFGIPTAFSGLIMQFQAQIGIRYRF